MIFRRSLTIAVPISVLIGGCATAVSGDQAFPLGPNALNVNSTNRGQFEKDREECRAAYIEGMNEYDRMPAQKMGFAPLLGLLGPVGIIGAGVIGAATAPSAEPPRVSRRLLHLRMEPR